MSQLTFNTDAMATIQCAVTANKPLMMLIKDDDISADKWISELLVNNTNLQSSSKEIINRDFFRLQLTKGSKEFQNLLAIMPMFEHAKTPCIFCVFKGQVIDFIPQEADPTEIEAKILKMETTFKSSTPALLIQEENTSLPTVESTQSARSSSDRYQSQTPPPNYYSPSPEPVQQNSEFKNNKADKKNVNTNVNKTLKEASNDMAARVYQENLAKQRKQAREDRQRILKLMELDRLEKKRKKEVEFNAEGADEVHENLHNSKLLNSDNYTLQLKLLDGTTIRRQFSANVKLTEVRNYILENYQDYHSVKFYFFKPVERVTYGDADENKTLHDLNLNMTTLILKPIEHEPESVIATEYPRSKFSWLRTKMSSLIWGNQQPILEGQSSNTSVSGSASSNNHEGESEPNSVYHTPILTQASSSGNLKPVLSSFNLYGSLHNDERGSEPHLPINEESEDILYRKKSASPSDEIDFHNGNSISLKFPDEPK